jgi:hypothetical protein
MIVSSSLPIFTLSVLAIAFGGGVAVAQSSFLPDGQNGAEFSFSGAWSGGSAADGGMIGFSVNGRVDLRFGLASVSVAQATTSFGPAIEPHVAKATAPSPLGASLGVSIDMMSAGVAHGELSDAFSVFASVRYLFELSPLIGVMPEYELQG